MTAEFSRLQAAESTPADVLRYAVDCFRADGDASLHVIDRAQDRSVTLAAGPEGPGIDLAAHLLDAVARVLNLGVDPVECAALVNRLCMFVAESPTGALPFGLKLSEIRAARSVDTLLEVEGADPPAFVRVVEGDEPFVEYLAGADLERHQLGPALGLPFEED